MGTLRLTGATIEVEHTADAEEGGRRVRIRHGGDTFVLLLGREDKRAIGLQLLSDEIEAVRAALKKHDKEDHSD